MYLNEKIQISQLLHKESEESGNTPGIEACLKKIRETDRERMKRMAKGKAQMTGLRFGGLTVGEDSGQRKQGCILWRCRCDCGREILLMRNQLISGKAVSCGCSAQEKLSSDAGTEELTGRQFGELTVIRRAENDKNNRARWLCRCSCGREREVYAFHLINGHTRSCGCKKYSISYNKRDLTGQRFGRLTALYPGDSQNRFQKGVWHCRCDCGEEIDVFAGSLLTGATRSCGCLNHEQRRKMHEHMHYQNDTCVERLVRAQKEGSKNKAGFRGLYRTKNGSYHVMITFRKVHYNLGYFKNYDAAVQTRLQAEEILHKGYLEAFEKYQEKARKDSAWAEQNPFFYNVVRMNGKFHVDTNAS